jgi:hypothetical protein
MSNKKGTGRLISGTNEIEEESNSLKERLLQQQKEKGTSLNDQTNVDSLLFEEDKEP